MDRSVFFARKCLCRTLTGFAALVFLVTTPVHARETSPACKLLQPAELDAALGEWARGGKATKFSGFTTNSGAIVLDSCSSEIVRPGHGSLDVTVLIVENHPMEGGDFLRKRNGALAREGQWKVKGAQFEEQTLGNAICTLAGRPNVPAHSVCSIPRARGYVEVDVKAPSQKEMASMAAVHSLVQKAYARL